MSGVKDQKKRGYGISPKARKNVTLCCIDTFSPELGYAALLRSLDLFEVEKAIFISPEKPECLDFRVNWIKVEKFQNIKSYSHFILNDLFHYISSSHVLIVQWDGQIINPNVWSDDFLLYDYIGAVWPQFEDGSKVGNGGFSLRSRKILALMADRQMVRHHPEDVCICRTNRERLETKFGIRFAPEEVARKFSFERDSSYTQSFGFHGLFNFPIVFPSTYNSEISNIPVKMLSNFDSIDLAKYLIIKNKSEDKIIVYKILLSIIFYRPYHIFKFFKKIFRVFFSK